MLTPQAVQGDIHQSFNKTLAKNTVLQNYMTCTHNNFDSKVKFTHTKNKRFVCTTFSLGGIRNCETTRLYRRANPCGTHSVWLLWDLQEQFKEACLMIATVCSEEVIQSRETTNMALPGNNSQGGRSFGLAHTGRRYTQP